MRWVLDTNVTASALLWDGAPRRLLLLARTNAVRLYTSPPLLDELEAILNRRKFDKKIAASGLTVAQLVERYVGLTTPVRPLAVVGIAPDPDDNVVIGTALAARADFLITGDRGLLAVVKHGDVRIVSVTQALAAIDATP